MIFPEEYKHIGWTEEGKTVPEDKKRIYFLSQYVLEKTADGYNLYAIEHIGSGFMRTPKGERLIASSEEIVFCEEILNIKNRTLLIEKAAEICRKENKVRKEEKLPLATTVLFKGIDRHLTFIKDPDPSEILEIEVIDIFPPEPPWLIDCVRRLEKSSIFGDLQIRFTEKTTDISIYQSDRTIYPCRSSGLQGKFLDSDMIEGNPKNGKWLLVGCDTTKTIFETLHPDKEYDFIEMCPKRSDMAKPEKPFVMRCCKSENSGNIIKINGQIGIIVHWGAGEWQISEAIRKLVSELRKKE